jgi:hypothetical protein
LRHDCVLPRRAEAVQPGYCSSQSGVRECIDSLTWFNRDLGKGSFTNWKSLKRNRHLDPPWVLTSTSKNTLLTLPLPTCIPPPSQQYARNKAAPCGLGSDMPSIC